VQFQLRQDLAAGEFIVLDDKIALLVVGPVLFFASASAGAAMPIRAAATTARIDIKGYSQLN
jgi:hypothetical protein